MEDHQAPAPSVSSLGSFEQIYVQNESVRVKREVELIELKDDEEEDVPSSSCQDIQEEEVGGTQECDVQEKEETESSSEDERDELEMLEVPAIKLEPEMELCEIDASVQLSDESVEMLDSSSDEETPQILDLPGTSRLSAESVETLDSSSDEENLQILELPGSSRVPINGFHVNIDTQTEPPGSGVPQFMCKYCPRKFNFFYSLRRHSIGRHGKFPYCLLCKQTFELESEMKKHLATCSMFESQQVVDSTLAVQCEFCHENFTSELELKSHRDRVHTIEESNEDNNTEVLIPINCEFCDARYLTEKDMRVHLSKAHSSSMTRNTKERFYYPRINDAFNSSMTYEAKEINLIKFDIAIRKKMESLDHLNFTIHCTTCNQDFSEKSYLDYHIQKCLHKEEGKRYRCPFCGKLKSSITDVTIFTHLRSHLDKPITYCYLCDRNFYTKYNFQCHFGKYHKNCKIIEARTKEVQKLETNMDTEEIEVLFEHSESRSEFSTSRISILPQASMTQILPSDVDIIAVPSPPEFSLASQVNSPETETTNIKKIISELKRQIQTKNPRITSMQIVIYCNECKQDFLVLDYISHIVKCPKLSRLKCTFCTNFSNTFTISEYLKHIRIHLNHYYKLFQCNTCDVQFINHYNYKIHMLRKHGSLKMS